MTSIAPLTEHQESILRFIETNSPSLDDIGNEFDGVLNNKDIKNSLEELKRGRYVKIEQHLAAGGYSIDDDFDNLPTSDDYILTPIGKNYLANTATANQTLFSNISNSNIANQSQNVNQTIKISEEPQDIQEKVKELELAILKKDSLRIKKAFGYIADKSIDVAIAIVSGVLLK